MLGKTHLYTGLAAGILAERTSALINALAVVQSDGATEKMVMAALFDSPSLAIGPLTTPSLLLIYGAVGLGALLPDMDEPNSLAANLPRLLSGGIKRHLGKRGLEGILSGLIQLALMPLNALNQLLAVGVRLLAGGHRAATHRLTTAVLIAIATSLIGWLIGLPSLGLWLFLGYTSHLALDMMTLSGLAVWEPFSAKKWHLLPPLIRIRTGGLVDRALGWLALILGVSYATITTGLPFLILAASVQSTVEGGR